MKRYFTPHVEITCLSASDIIQNSPLFETFIGDGAKNMPSYWEEKLRNSNSNN